MKFGVLAFDYDGTIARDGALDPHVRKAIAHARSRGVVTILVTGRILADLKHVAGDLDFVDAIVAENGGLFTMAGERGATMLGDSPPLPIATARSADCTRSPRQNGSHCGQLECQGRIGKSARRLLGRGGECLQLRTLLQGCGASHAAAVRG